MYIVRSSIRTARYKKKSFPISTQRTVEKRQFTQDYIGQTAETEPRLRLPKIAADQSRLAQLRRRANENACQPSAHCGITTTTRPRLYPPPTGRRRPQRRWAKVINTVHTYMYGSLQIQQRVWSIYCATFTNEYKAVTLNLFLGMFLPSFSSSPFPHASPSFLHFRSLFLCHKAVLLTSSV